MSWNWSREKLVLSLLHSPMWTAAGTWVAKGKGWIKLSLWAALSAYYELKWLRNLGPGDSLHPFTVLPNKTIPLCVLTIYLHSVTLSGSKEKKMRNPHCRVFSVVPQMTLLSLPDSSTMKEANWKENHDPFPPRSNGGVEEEETMSKTSHCPNLFL